MKLISINNRRYIGSKARMLDYINDVMKKEKITFSSFFDLFGGTGIVGDYFNDSKTKIYVNDLLKSNYLSYLAWFGNDKIDKKPSTLNIFLLSLVMLILSHTLSDYFCL